MKIYRILCLGVALALPHLVLAKLQLPNDVFGKIEGSLDFCAQVDPQSAAKYQEQKKLLIQGASDEEVAEARASQEYKDGYDEVTQEMSKQPKDQVAKSCAAALESR